jgi:hypothetical protein
MLEFVGFADCLVVYRGFGYSLGEIGDPLADALEEGWHPLVVSPTRTYFYNKLSTFIIISSFMIQIKRVLINQRDQR